MTGKVIHVGDAAHTDAKRLASHWGVSMRQVVERLIRTLKSEGLRRFLLPLRVEPMRTEVELIGRWYNEHRPHRRFGGATPADVRDGVMPAVKRPRFETRARMPSKEKLPAKCGVVVELDVRYLEGRRHLPVVGLKRVA